MTKELKQLIDYNCKALENAEGTYREIYETMFRLENEVMYETDDGYRIHKVGFQEAREEIEKIAGALYARIGATHEYIALEMDNCPQWIIAFWAILRSGNKPYLVNLRHPIALSEGILETLKIRYILGMKKTSLPGEFIDYQDLSKEAGESKAPEDVFENEIALSTSATSLKETICFYSGRRMTNQLLNTRAILNENKRISMFYHGAIKQLVFLPLYHVFGLIAVYFWFSFFGRTMVFMKDYSAESILNACKLHEVTHIFAVPLFWNTIEKEIRKTLKERGEKTEAKFEKGLKICTRLQNIFPYAGAKMAKKIMHEVTDELFGPSVQFCITGGSYLKDSTLAMFNGMGYPLFNGYGMSEIGITSVELAATPKLRNLNSIGRPFKGVEYRLDSEGVLEVKSASACDRRLIDGETLPMEEWFSTGDILKEENGRYYMLGRKGDAVIGESGENINPDGVEQAFDLHDVTAFSVLGIKKDETERLSMVICLPRETTEEGMQEIINRVYATNNTLPMSHQVQDFYFTYDAIMPETAIKVGRKYLLRGIDDGSITITPFGEFKLKPVSANERLDSKLADKVREIFAEALDKNPEEIGDDDHLLNDLGCDSLVYMGIMVKICNVFDIDVEGPVEEHYYTVREITTKLEEGGYTYEG